jgi:hypothetical protein
MGRRVLVVSTVESAPAALRARIGGEVDEVKVVVPVVKQSFLDWLANDERAHARADEAAHRTAAILPGADAESGAGEADVALAVQDALATFAADEIVIVTHPEDEATWLEDESGVPAGSFRGVPVRRVRVSAP